jgi:hypothetical protein
MADNVPVTAGAGTNIATDDIGSVHYQRVKLTWGVDGVATDASATNPIPVTRANSTVVASAKLAVATPGTQVQCTGGACDWVIVKASRNNQSTIYLGGSAVSSADGLELDPGDATWLDVTNTNAVWVDALVAGDYVTFAWGA